MSTKYFIQPLWNRPGWFAVCYLNSVLTTTMYCEAPSGETAVHLASLLNIEEDLRQADEAAIQRLAEFDRTLLELANLKKGTK
jgi:hypothetical protein